MAGSGLLCCGIRCSRALVDDIDEVADIAANEEDGAIDGEQRSYLELENIAARHLM